MRLWLTRVVAVADLADVLSELERTHPPAGPPILTYVDQTRVIISWPYFGDAT